MSEFSESVYIRADDRQVGVDWLTRNELTGYVLEPKNGWVQVLPNWGGTYNYDEAAFRNAPGQLLYYCFAEDHLWSFFLYDQGQCLFTYKCAWETAQFDREGISAEEVAERLGVPYEKLEPLLFTGEEEGLTFEELVDSAAWFVDLVGLPNASWMSFLYMHADAEMIGLDRFYVDPASEKARQAAAEGPMDAVQIAVRLAGTFLKRLRDEELLDLTSSAKAAVEQLEERLAMAMVNNPVSNEAQLLAHWLDELMNSPVVEDVFASDEDLLQIVRETVAQVTPAR